MKKKRLFMAALLVFTILGMPLSAKALDSINVVYQVDPSYEVLIPANAEIPFMAENTTCGTIEVKEAVLEENKCILVNMNSGGALINEENPKAKIPYRILSDDKPFTAGKYTKAGEKTKLTISIKKEDWEKAAGGTYKTAITFTISYVDKE